VSGFRNTILLGDVRDRIGNLPDASVDAVITSPPYFALRDYGVAGQLGAESSVDEWVAGLVVVMDEVARVLKPSGTVWLNVGDRYSRHERMGAPSKSLLGGPERLMLALIARGWIVRNKIVWAKPNSLPDSVKDRLTTTYEVVFLLARSPRYYFDLDAIRVPHLTPVGRSKNQVRAKALQRSTRSGRSHHPLGKNPGDVWTVATSRYRGAHFATFPEGLVEKPLLASVPQRVCITCGQPWLVRTLGVVAVDGLVHQPRRRFSRVCTCRATWQPGLVLDPFMGSGTVAVVAQKRRRDWLGIELNAEYREMALKRLAEAKARRLAA
jgi:DNA modification methylase